MKIEKTPIEGLLIIHPEVFKDDRGFFFENYNAVKFEQLGLRTDWVQSNHARSQQQTLRGLHFQRGKGQAKCVRCIQGRVWDVAVDIRPDSNTFAQWFGLELNEDNKKMILIPEGFAHGYCVLSPMAEVAYKCSTVYDAQLEAEIKWNDSALGVQWPIGDPFLSKRDVEAQSFQEYLDNLKNSPLSDS
jgi:dTDP-4-dehydrorhamnose 3,5-epimerase